MYCKVNEMKNFCHTFYLVLLMLLGSGFMAYGLKAQEPVVAEASSHNIHVYVTSNNRLIVENSPKEGELILEIFSIVGVKVYSEKVKGGTNEYVINLPKGYYIVKIGNVVKKIAVK